MKKVMSKDGSYKYIKTGFSWTTYFLGCIPSICRGDFKNALKIFILGILTLGIYTDIKSFTINKDYEYYLINLGYSEIGYIKEGIAENSIYIYSYSRGDSRKCCYSNAYNSSIKSNLNL